MKLAQVRQGGKNVVKVIAAAFIPTIEAWTMIVESIEETCDQQAIGSMDKGLENIGKIGLEKGLFIMNRQILRQLDYDDNDEELEQDDTDWNLECLRHMASNASRHDALIKLREILNQNTDLEEQNLELYPNSSPRTEYTQVCIDDIHSLVGMYPEGAVA